MDGMRAQQARRRGPAPIVAALLLATLLCGAVSRLAAQATTRPNILWISNEDMSPRLGAYGDPVARTPTLDALAKQSVRFTNAFTTAPVCAPSRAAIITGMYQPAIGAQHMRTTESTFAELPGPYLAVPPFYVKAFPEYLRAAGYYTTNNYKTDYQFGEPATVWDEVGTTAHWRNRPDKSQPFFSVFNLMITHESQLFGQANRAKPRVTDPARVQVPPYYPDTPAVREEIARFYDRIADMDGQVGQILKQLDEDGLADNPIVFYWSDHGDAFPRSKRSLYDSGLKVPLMIRWPGRLNPAFPAGSVNDQLVSFVDLAPTVLALAGVDIPAHMQGRVLVGPKAQPEPQYVFAARDRMDMEYDMIRGARDRQYLYVRNFQPELPYVGLVQYRNQSLIMQELLRLQAEGRLTGPQTLWLQTHRPPEELYDTRADPHDVHNLAGDPAHAATLARMRGATTDWMTRIGDQGLINEAEMVQRMWPGGVQPVTAAPFILKRGSTPAPAAAGEGAAAGGGVARDSVQSFSGPTEVEIYVPTQGASVSYTTDPGPNARWRLYAGPFRLQGPVTVRAKAIRYGYRESAETRTVFTTASTAAPR
jgi:N-sulfoglucosamine sulfohydrolase